MLCRPRRAPVEMEAAALVRAETRVARQALAGSQPAVAAQALKRARSQRGYERDPALMDLWHQAGLQGGRRSGLRGAHLQRTLQGARPPSVLSPDGRLAITGDALDKQVLRLWDLASGECVHQLKGHNDPVTVVRFTRDGRFAVSAGGAIWKDGRSPDSALRLWDLKRGRCVRSLEGHTDPVGSVALAPDGRHALSGDTTDPAAARRPWSPATPGCHRGAVRALPQRREIGSR